MRCGGWRAAARRLAVVSLPVVLLGAGLVAAAAPGAPAHPRATPRSSASALRAVFDLAYRAPGAFPGSIAEARRAGRRYDIPEGVADLATRRRPRAGAHVRIGSITKTFVATVTLQLVAEHRLRLTDTVDDLLPGLLDRNGNDGHAITVRMLLNHTSGLYDYVDQEAEQLHERQPFLTFTPRRLVEWAVSHPPVFPPGTSWKYSNTNYILLGMVIKRVTGHSYAAEIARRIEHPLGLRETYSPGTSPDLPPPFMHGYTLREGRITDVTRFNPSWAGSAGDMVSTVGDLQRFDSALLRGRLLPPRLLRQMLTPVPGSDVFPGHGSYRYGLGLIIATLPCGVTVYGHGGTIDGSLSWVAGTRDGRHTMSFDVNGDWVDQPALTGAADRAEFCSTAGRGTPPSPEHRDPVPPAAWLRAARRP